MKGVPMGIGSVAGAYANFVFGTGQETVTNTISNAIKNRGSKSYLSALYDGTKGGIRDSYNAVKSSGGYLNTVKSDFGSMINTFKNESGLKKLSGLTKGMPLIMNLAIYWRDIAGIFKAGKNEGIGSGVKEAGRTAAGIGISTLLSSLAQGMAKAKGAGNLWGTIAGVVGYTAGTYITNKLFGKSYDERVAEGQTEKQPQTNNAEVPGQPEQPNITQPPVQPQGGASYTPNVPVSPNISFHGNMPTGAAFPSIESNPYGGYYGFNNPGALFNSASMMSPMMGMGMMGMGMMGMPMMGMGGAMIGPNGSTSGNLISNG